MKILFFGDLHLREKGSFLPYHKITDRGLTYELENILSSADFVCQMVEEHIPDYLIFLGDMFDDKNILTKRTIHVAGLYLQKIIKCCEDREVKFRGIPGNHDTSVEIGNSIINYLTAFDSQLFQVITSEYVITDDFGEKIGIFPFSKNEDRIQSWLENTEDCRVRFTHLEFSGFEMDNGYPTDGIMLEGKYAPIISGHLHKKQYNERLGIYYPGSIIQNKFQQRDLESVGGVGLWENGKVSHFPNTISKHYVRVDDIKQIDKLDPKKCLLRVQLPCDYEEVKSLLKDFEHMFFKKTIADDVKKTVVTTGYIDPKSLFLDHLMNISFDHHSIAEEVLNND